VQHRFVNELFAGAVPDAVTARYLIQDCVSAWKIHPSRGVIGVQL
jgi:hypothetical protein